MSAASGGGTERTVTLTPDKGVAPVAAFQAIRTASTEQHVIAVVGHERVVASTAQHDIVIALVHRSRALAGPDCDNRTHGTRPAARSHRPEPSMRRARRWHPDPAVTSHDAATDAAVQARRRQPHGPLSPQRPHTTRKAASQPDVISLSSQSPTVSEPSGPSTQVAASATDQCVSQR